MHERRAILGSVRFSKIRKIKESHKMSFYAKKLFYVILYFFLFFKNCTLSREPYAFPKVTSENRMVYDITAAILKNGGKKCFLIDFIEIFQSKMKRLHVNKSFDLIILEILKLKTLNSI